MTKEIDIEEGYKELVNELRLELGKLRRRAIAEPSEDIEFQILIIEEDIRNFEKTYKNIEMLNHDKDVSLPPFVVNDLNPVISLAENADWGINTLRIREIHAEFGLTGKGVRVAIIDTAPDPNHEDLKGGVVETANVTSENVPPSNGHHIGCAGIIGARKNDIGIISVAPDCEMIGIKALNENGSGSLDDVARAINLAVDKRVHIISLSLGGSAQTASLQQAVNRAVAAGIYVIAAAGNSGTDNSVGYPAKYQNVVAVGATNQQNKSSAFSSRGQEVDIAAPGERVLTTWKNNTYATVSGTSFATPYVSGCYALFVQAGIKISLDLLKETAIDIEEPGQDVRSGYGLINPYAIIKKYYKPVVTHCDVPTGVYVGNVTPNSFSLTWDSTDPTLNYNYLVHYRETTSSSWKGQATTNNVQTISGLRPGITYEVKVQSVCGSISSDFSQVFQVVTSDRPNDLTKVKQAYDLLGQYINENQ